MKMIRILPRKCATFRVKDGADTLVHEIKPMDRMILQDAPAWVQDDPLFGWMVADGSIEVVEVPGKAADAMTLYEGHPLAGEDEAAPESSAEEDGTEDAPAPKRRGKKA